MEDEEDEKNREISEQERELISNINNFNDSANLVYKRGDYTSAAILYFKALFSIFDLIIFREKGFVPKDHSERFRILENDFLEQYNFLDRNFSIYQNSYRTSIKKEDCDIAKTYAEGIIKEQEI